jgi:hypothetical protein
MVDGSISTFASANAFRLETFSSTNAPGSNLGSIIKVEARVYGYRSAGAVVGFHLNIGGVDYIYNLSEVAAWTPYLDITGNHAWSWSELPDLSGYLHLVFPFWTVVGVIYVAKVELHITYIEEP